VIVQQFFVKGLAHSSYLLGGSQACAIVDPRRDTQIYLDAAQDMGMKITHILETHLHADFVSGHRDLAKKTGAIIYAPRAGRCSFDHFALSEGDVVGIDELSINVMETPGHTPEHLSYVITDKERGSDPVGVFCGDTLFVGDVGRPDLFPCRAQELASKLYKSLHDKLLKLPDFCEVYPAHGAGSLCGRAMGAKRTSTIGYEKKYNQALQMKDRDKFVLSLTHNMPETPDHFSRCSSINAIGPDLTETLPIPEGIEAARFAALARKESTVVLDLRSYDAFGGQHIPGAFHIDFGGNFSTFSGCVLPPGHDVLLVSFDATQANDAAVWLHRVGLDRVIGYLQGGMFEWAKAGFPTSHVRQLSAEELQAISKGDKNITLVDVRAPSEYEKFHIDGSINIPAPELRTRYSELDPNVPVITICSTGHRSSLAASLLKQQGFEVVSNAAGGMTAYAAADYGPECPVCVLPHGPHFLGKRA